ncbi:hypothetical protein Tco_1380327 [Tanacetum coccineum]
MASSSRFHNTKCFQYDKRDSEDVCILKCDSKPGSVAHHAVKIKYEADKVSWWNVEEDDKALYLLRAMTADPSKEYSSPRYTESENSIEELPRLAEPASGTTRAVFFPFNVTYTLQNPQAIRIIVGLGGQDAAGQETDDPFQGYASELFLPGRLFNVKEVKQDLKAVMMFVDALMIFEVVPAKLKWGLKSIRALNPNERIATRGQKAGHDDIFSISTKVEVPNGRVKMGNFC